MKYTSFRPSLRRVALVLLLNLIACTPALAKHPALWVAQDADTTVYLFGTVHLMPDDVSWQFPALGQALASSSVLYTEIADIDNTEVQALTMKLGIDMAEPLSASLSDSENTLLQKAVETLAIPGGTAAFEMMKPWLAGVTLAVAPLVKAGMDPNKGVDKLLQAQAKEAGKPVKGLETAAEQIQMLAGMPDDVQMDFLRSALRDYKHATTELKAIIDAWKVGDVDGLTVIIADKMAKESPKLYQRLLVKRNVTWAHTLTELMKTTPGTVFVAVGAGHLAGPDRVQVHLQKLGINVERVADKAPEAITSY